MLVCMLENTHRRVFSSWLVIWLLAVGAGAEGSISDPPAEAVPTLYPGKQAPDIEVEEFLRGTEVKSFRPGHVYVVEFWATWCGPCVERFGHLSEIQRKYAGKVTIIGINIWEEKEYSEKTLPKVREFMNAQGTRMSYTVAYDGAAAGAANAYMKAANQSGIPTAFLVDQAGRVAWIGHPAVMEAPLAGVLRGDFDIETAKAKFDQASMSRAEIRTQRLEAQPLMKEWSALWEAGKKDEALPLMEEVVHRWPRIGYDPAYKTINYLLAEKKDSAAARRFADVLIDNVYKDNSSGLYVVTSAIVDPEILAPTDMLETAQRAIDRALAIEDTKRWDLMMTLARVQFLKGDAASAVATQEKAIEMIESDLELKKELETDLEKYRGAAKNVDSTPSGAATSPSK
ncbi:MAG: redoxin family protein [Phycisphaerales bacterium]|nr:redoxin family protein [Phycisphaerales bacterium]